MTDTINISNVIKNPVKLRNELIFWAIDTELTDLIDTFQGDFMDKFFKAKIKPNALTSEDVMTFVFNPRKTICEANITTKLIVSENLTGEDFQVK